MGIVNEPSKNKKIYTQDKTKQNSKIFMIRLGILILLQNFLL